MWGAAIGGALAAAGSVAGGLMGQSSAAQASQANYEAQKEFAQNGIRWKVADAKAAGLHPLAALGAQTSSYTPSAIVGDTSWMGDAASQLGQGIGRAVEAKMTAKERMQQRAAADESVRLSMETKRLQNQYLETQIAAQKQDMALQLARSAAMAVRTQQAVPGMPSIGGDGTVIAGQAQAYPTGKTELETSKVPTSLRGDPSTQAGMPPDSRTHASSGGALRSVYPTEQMGDTLDALWPIGMTQWYFRNQLLPYIGNFTDLVHDPRRQPGEYFDLLSGGYRKGRRIRDYFR